MHFPNRNKYFSEFFGCAISVRLTEQQPCPVGIKLQCFQRTEMQSSNRFIFSGMLYYRVKIRYQLSVKSHQAEIHALEHEKFILTLNSYNVRINLKSITDKKFSNNTEKKLAELLSDCEELLKKISKNVEECL